MELAELLVQVSAILADSGEELIDLVEEGKGDAAGDRTAAKSGAVHSLADRFADGFSKDGRAKREAGGQRFGGYDGVRQAEFPIGEAFAVRPRPHCVSSAIQRALRSVARVRMAVRNSRLRGWIPPSP